MHAFVSVDADIMSSVRPLKDLDPLLDAGHDIALTETDTVSVAQSAPALNQHHVLSPTTLHLENKRASGSTASDCSAIINKPLANTGTLNIQRQPSVVDITSLRGEQLPLYTSAVPKHLSGDWSDTNSSNEPSPSSSRSGSPSKHEYSSRY